MQAFYIHAVGEPVCAKRAVWQLPSISSHLVKKEDAPARVGVARICGDLTLVAMHNDQVVWVARIQKAVRWPKEEVLVGGTAHRHNRDARHDVKWLVRAVGLHTGAEERGHAEEADAAAGAPTWQELFMGAGMPRRALIARNPAPRTLAPLEWLAVRLRAPMPVLHQQQVQLCKRATPPPGS